MNSVTYLESNTTNGSSCFASSRQAAADFISFTFQKTISGKETHIKIILKYEWMTEYVAVKHNT